MQISRFRRATASVAVLASVAFIAAGCGSDDDDSKSESKDTKTTTSEMTTTEAAEATETIAALAQKNPDLSTLVKAAAAAGIVETLNGTDEFTVFAPTNEAFAKVPKATLDQLLTPAGKADLTKILTYHAVKGKVMAADLKDGQEVETLNGAKLLVKVNDDGTVTIGGAKVTTADVEASNGVVHVIDTVLMPPADAAAAAGTTTDTMDK